MEVDTMEVDDEELGGEKVDDEEINDKEVDDEDIGDENVDVEEDVLIDASMQVKISGTRSRKKLSFLGPFQ
jgi:hypothetical protein